MPLKELLCPNTAVTSSVCGTISTHTPSAHPCPTRVSNTSPEFVSSLSSQAFPSSTQQSLGGSTSSNLQWKILPPESPLPPSTRRLHPPTNKLHPSGRLNPPADTIHSNMQSPEKPTPSKVGTFINVERFLTSISATGPARELEPDRLVGKSGFISPPLPAQLRPPTGAQGHFSFNLLSGQPSTVRKNDVPFAIKPSSLVNQHPIPATSETFTHMSARGIRVGGVSFKVAPRQVQALVPPPIASSLPPSLSTIPIGFINPNTLLASPSHVFSPPLLSSSAGSASLLPFQPNLLPPFSALCQPATSDNAKTTLSNSYPQATPTPVLGTTPASRVGATPISEVGGAVVEEISPPKRAKLD